MTELLKLVFGKVGISIISSCILFLVGRLWKGTIRPSLENTWYNGTRLAPYYVGEFTFDGEKKKDIIRLKQRAHRVWGTMVFPEGTDGMYEFEATLRDNVLRGVFNGARLKPNARGSFLLRLVPGNRDLEGAFMQPLKDKVVVFEYKWTPKSY